MWKFTDREHVTLGIIWHRSLPGIWHNRRSWKVVRTVKDVGSKRQTRFAYKLTAPYRFFARGPSKREIGKRLKIGRTSVRRVLT
jgi:hypothetical protein